MNLVEQVTIAVLLAFRFPPSRIRVHRLLLLLPLQPSRGGFCVIRGCVLKVLS
jgi:hypothetical protein